VELSNYSALALEVLENVAVAAHLLISEVTFGGVSCYPPDDAIEQSGMSSFRTENNYTFVAATNCLLN
jgi:hypothetical protein